MLSFIRKRFWHSHNALKSQKLKNDVHDLVVESFPRDGFVRVKNKGSNISLDIPIGKSINSNLQELEEEIKRFKCIQNFERFIKKPKNRRFIIYQGDPVHYGLIKFLIEKNIYKEYHIFCNDSDSYNILQDLARINIKRTIRLNGPELNTSSMFRILRNEYDDYYNLDKNDDVLVLLKNNNELIEQLYCTLYWLRSCYVSIPYNRFIIEIIRYLFRYQLSITVESIHCGYCIIKSSILKDFQYTTEQILKPFLFLKHDLVKSFFYLLDNILKIIYNN